MKYIGLVMINGEDDILEETLANNVEYVDAFYVLDGTVPNDDSRAICESFRKCVRYSRDEELPRPPYPDKPVSGYFQHIYEQAAADHGYDNWFLILNGDEIWTQDPRELDDDDVDQYVFRLPFYFPRQGEEWDYSRSAIEQLRWSLGPGWPDPRMFRGAPDVQFDVNQHPDVTPRGLYRTVHVPVEIKHYLYRSPDNQRARALRHVETGIDPDNYRHILERDEVYWTDAMIAAAQAASHGNFTQLRQEAQDGSPAVPV